MPRILIVDDEAHVRGAVVLALRAAGFEAVGVEDAKAALREAAARPIDLAIVDVYMPQIDGVKLIKALRERAPGLPIIAMSGVPLKGSQQTALDYLPKLPGMGEIVCLTKPFRAGALMHAVQTALGVAKPMAAAAQG